MSTDAGTVNSSTLILYERVAGDLILGGKNIESMFKNIQIALKSLKSL